MEKKYITHDCNFQKEIVDLVSGVSQANTSIGNLHNNLKDYMKDTKESISALTKITSQQQVQINDLNSFRNSAKALVAVIVTLVGVLATLFCGTFTHFIK